jgi:hypothetical protein
MAKAPKLSIAAPPMTPDQAKRMAAIFDEATHNFTGQFDELESLLIYAIQPMHIRQYMDIRGEVARTRANREKALFSHVYNKARDGATRRCRIPAKASRATRKLAGTATSPTKSLRR